MKLHYYTLQGSKRIISIIILLLSFFFFFNNFSNAQSWNALGSGTNGTIYATTVFNGELIVAGSFSTAGGVSAANIARWNGSTWAALGSGTNGPVYALTIYSGQLIVGGSFSTAGGSSANNVARWTGSTWASLGLGTNNIVYCLAYYSNYLRVGGSFTTAGGIAANRVALWNGSSWGTMGSGLNNTAYAMQVRGSELIITGIFTTAGGSTHNRIVRYQASGANYLAMGTGLDNGGGYALTLISNDLYVGGSFTTIGGVTVNRIARWTGSNWVNLGSGVNNNIASLAFINNELVAGGSFTTANGLTANYIARWNGSTWSTFGTGMSGGTTSVNALISWAGVMVAAGWFTSAGGTSANNVAAWGSVPAAPTLISPPDGAVDISLTPALDWSDVSGASTYGAQVATDANFANLVVNVSQIPTSNYTVTSTLNNNTIYFWRANARNGIGTSVWSLIRWFRTLVVGVINTQEIPLSFKLYQNYPNPFNPLTTIKFDLPSSNTNEILKVSLFDISGKEVAVLLDTKYHAGKWELTYDATHLSSGVYFYRIEAGGFQETMKMTLVK